MKRREVLSAIGVLSVSGLAGCQSPVTDERRTLGEREEIDGITVRDIPPSSSIQSGTTVVVSDDIVEESDLIRSGMQIRARLKTGSDVDWPELPAVYTTTTDPKFTSDLDRTIWMSKAARDRCFATPEMEMVVNPYATSPTFSTRNSAQENNEYVENVIENRRSQLLFCAPYGGNMFANSGRQSIFCGSEIDDASSWTAYGYDQLSEGRNRWFVEPDSISKSSYHELDILDDDYDACIMFSGSDQREDRSNVYIGGLAPTELKNNLRDKLEPTVTSFGGEIEVVSSGPFSATDTNHIVNQMSSTGSRGLQIVQGQAILDAVWQEIAERVIEFVGEEELV